MLAHGANPDAKNDDGDSPLSTALYNHKDEIAAILAQKSEAINGSKAIEGLIIKSASTGCLETMQFALDKKRQGEVPFQAETLVKALQAAENQGQSACAVRLIQVGAPVEKIEKDTGRYVIHHAAKHKEYLSVLPEIMAKGHINDKDAEGITPLFESFLGKNYMGSLILLKNGAIYTEPEPWHQRMPAHFAAAGSPEVLRWLISHNAQVRCFDDIGRTPLHYAAESGNLKVIKLLAAYPDLLDTKDIDGWTPLHYAAARGDMRIIRRLIQMGANPNIETKSGELPHIIAAKKGRGQAATILYQYETKNGAKRHDPPRQVGALFIQKLLLLRFNL